MNPIAQFKVEHYHSKQWWSLTAGTQADCLAKLLRQARISFRAPFDWRMTSASGRVVAHGSANGGKLHSSYKRPDEFLPGLFKFAEKTLEA